MEASLSVAKPSDSPCSLSLRLRASEYSRRMKQAVISYMSALSFGALGSYSV